MNTGMMVVCSDIHGLSFLNRFCVRSLPTSSVAQVLPSRSRFLILGRSNRAPTSAEILSLPIRFLAYMDVFDLMVAIVVCRFKEVNPDATLRANMGDVNMLMFPIIFAIPIILAVYVASMRLNALLPGCLT